MARISVACHDGTSYIQCGTLRSGLLSMPDLILELAFTYGKLLHVLEARMASCSALDIVLHQ